MLVILRELKLLTEKPCCPSASGGNVAKLVNGRSKMFIAVHRRGLRKTLRKYTKVSSIEVLHKFRQLAFWGNESEVFIDI